MRRFSLIGLLVVALLPAGVVPAKPADETPRVSHVVVIGMDNYHLDDIQAHMPNLWNFLSHSALSADSHHPDLPTKTAPDFSSIASGQYPHHHGAINNTFLTPGSPPESRVGFAYWENLARRSPAPFLSDPPWLPFNRAGWDVGAVGFEGLVLETREEVNAHLGRPPDSPLDNAARDQYWGIAIHRKNGTAAFGTAEIPEIKKEFPKGWEQGWAGPPRKHAATTLRMTTLMQAAGIPITFSYVENVHGRCTVGAQPPCQFDLLADTFVDLLEADDVAFGKFFDDLAALGITPANTLFVITTDEGDHYLPDFARSVDMGDLQPAVLGSNALFYAADADRLAAELAARPGVNFVATRNAMRALHIADGSDARTPTFMAFSDPDSTFTRGVCRTCFRWNHGNIDPDITDIWIALRGPGIHSGPLTGYSDHVDIIPTIRAALGLANTADTDGIAITAALEGSDQRLVELREVFKQLNAPLGRFGQGILTISTQGVLGGPEARAMADEGIADLADRRDVLVAKMRAILDGVEPAEPDRVRDLVQEANGLIAESEADS